MRALRRISPLFLLLIASFLFSIGPRAQTPQAQSAPAAAPQAVTSPSNPDRPWVGCEPEIEEFIRTAPVIKLETIDLGVTHPQRAWFAPGGPIDSIAWKPIRPALYSGYWESWKNEVAAYELDKLLQIHMVPPAVAKKIKGAEGAAIYWVHDTKMWKELKEVPKPNTPEWNVQMMHMKMFDNLIGNIDDNAGNILVSNNWTVYLIDHSRAFVPDDIMPQKLQNVDPSLWARVKALDEPRLKATLGEWLDGRSIRAILKRRDKMAKQIEEIEKKKTAS